MRGVAAQYTKEKKMGPTSQVLLYRDLSRQVIELRDRFSAFMRSFNGDEDDTFDSSFEFSHFDEYFIAWIETDLRVNLDDNLDLSPTWSYHHATLAPFVLIMAYSEYRTDPDRYQYWKLALEVPGEHTRAWTFHSSSPSSKTIRRPRRPPDWTVPGSRSCCTGSGVADLHLYPQSRCHAPSRRSL